MGRNAALSFTLRDINEQPALSSLDSEEFEDKKLRKLLNRRYHEDALSHWLAIVGVTTIRD